MVILTRMPGVNSKLKYTTSSANHNLHHHRHYWSIRAEVHVVVAFSSAMPKITRCDDTFISTVLSLLIQQSFVVGLTRPPLRFISFISMASPMETSLVTTSFLIKISTSS